MTYGMDFSGEFAMFVLVVFLKSGRSPPLSKTTAFREAAKRFLPFSAEKSKQ